MSTASSSFSSTTHLVTTSTESVLKRCAAKYKGDLLKKAEDELKQLKKLDRDIKHRSDLVVINVIVYFFEFITTNVFHSHVQYHTCFMNSNSLSNYNYLHTNLYSTSVITKMFFRNFQKNKSIILAGKA